jgi:hypothetical protein
MGDAILRLRATLHASSRLFPGLSFTPVCQVKLALFCPSCAFSRPAQGEMTSIKKPPRKCHSTTAPTCISPLSSNSSSLLNGPLATFLTSRSLEWDISETGGMKSPDLVQCLCSVLFWFFRCANYARALLSQLDLTLMVKRIESGISSQFSPRSSIAPNQLPVLILSLNGHRNPLESSEQLFLASPPPFSLSLSLSPSSPPLPPPPPSPPAFSLRTYR